MKILAIDTSCDDTCAAVLEINKNTVEVKSNIISSQVKIHKNYGGVVPGLAKRSHQENLTTVVKKALEKSNLLEKNGIVVNKKEIKKIIKREDQLLEESFKFLRHYKKPKIDFIGVTVGPGLEPCLWAGVNFAKILSYFWKIPVIPINHIEAHLVSAFLPVKNKTAKINNKFFPAVALTISGGHTQLVLINKFNSYKTLGETLDDAAGECLDKIAKTLELPYPGGPEIEKISKKGKNTAFDLPRPMIFSQNYNFSFSGLKTAVLYLTKKLGQKKTKKAKADIAASAQKAVIDVLTFKTLKAAREKEAKTIMLTGGVAANKELQKNFQNKLKNVKIDFLVPSKVYCTDNAAMVGFCAYLRKNSKLQSKQISRLGAKSNLKI
jgi:N6-L-threonylcarbamoyladenine synthase